MVVEEEAMEELQEPILDLALNMQTQEERDLPIPLPASILEVEAEELLKVVKSALLDKMEMVEMEGNGRTETPMVEAEGEVEELPLFLEVVVLGVVGVEG